MQAQLLSKKPSLARYHLQILENCAAGLHCLSWLLTYVLNVENFSSFLLINIVLFVTVVSDIHN